MANRDAAERIHPETPDAWREWLREHHEQPEGVWLLLWKRHTGKPTMTYDVAITEALAFGWIDGSSAPLDADRSMLWFVKRSPTSPWSRTNKDRIARLEAEGRLELAGRALVDAAKANGLWTILDEADALIEPSSLTAALDAVPAARKAWDASSRGVRRAHLTQLALAKSETTRARRIQKIVDGLAG